ncbi:ParB/RepB/Spo0J family partition protein [Hyphococcus luteus]|uniref:Partitioning protein n=1 Tax=Hyphococcus luteus TaxID=2058213 RepID=A0A2S7K6Z7_9PROT|nr:ParB/RepB/Spo0J family partition protein [Marinicaulis flavus]PQA88294.1 partitioning protein [Marinicaulis flavus]
MTTNNATPNTVSRDIPFSSLHISKTNMRYARKAPDVSDIYPSIRAKGVRQPLLVRPEGEGFGIVAGRRRYYALKQVEAETGQAPMVRCELMTDDDDASAIAASIIENVGRRDAHEMEEYVAFKRLHDAGDSVETIAEFFGIVPADVRRVLALASLSPAIRKLYADEEIVAETARALTLASKSQQTEWLRLFKDDNERAPVGRACRAWIAGGAAITTDKALFDLETYDGAVTTDLFGDHDVFADAGAFWKAQSDAVAARIDAYRERGWKDVVTLERGAQFASWDFVKTPKSQGGKVFVEIRHDGTVNFHEGLLRQAEARRHAANANGEKPAKPDPVKPEMSGPLAEYILLHRHGAAQASLAGEPAIALRLMVAHTLAGSALWDVRAHECRTRKAETEASLAASKAAADMKAKRERIASMFEALGDNGEARRNSDAYRLCEIFVALLAMADEEVMEVLAWSMAETLEPGGALVEAVLHVCETDLSAYWKPEPVFFDLCRDKRALNAMVADIATKSAAKACRNDPAKVQKAIIENRIAGKACDANPDWRPGWMQTPPQRLVRGAESAPADAWKRVAALFEPREAEVSSEPQSVPHSDAA